MWLKGNGRKVKVNALLDDGSNETFLNEEIAGVLGLKERYQTVKVNVLNNEVETFQSMPLEVTIESLDGEFCKDIKVKTCPKRVTGDYKVENWRQSEDRWVHLRECDFAEPAQDGYVDLLIGVDNAELMYVVRKELQLLALGLLDGHVLDHQKEDKEQGQGHMLVALCLPKSLLSALTVSAVMLIVR